MRLVLYVFVAASHEVYLHPQQNSHQLMVLSLEVGTPLEKSFAQTDAPMFYTTYMY